MLKVLEGGKSRNPESQDDEDGLGLGHALDELARQGARRMIAAALKVEADLSPMHASLLNGVRPPICVNGFSRPSLNRHAATIPFSCHAGGQPPGGLLTISRSLLATSRPSSRTLLRNCRRGCSCSRRRNRSARPSLPRTHTRPSHTGRTSDSTFPWCLLVEAGFIACLH
jgi:hypothetical protein